MEVAVNSTWREFQRGGILTAHDSIRHQCDSSQGVQKRSSSHSTSQSCARSQLTLESLQDNFMAKNWKKPRWHCISEKTEGLCPQRAAAGIWQFPKAGSLHVWNLMSCQTLLNVRKTRGKWHRAEHGTGRSTETEINSLARSISQLIFHEGFSPSPPAVFSRLWNDQWFLGGRWVPRLRATGLRTAFYLLGNE